MQRMLATAAKYADIELAQIKKETEKKLAQIRESYAAESMYRSSALVRAVKGALEDEIEKHGEATWKALHDILESSPRRYYRKSEIDQVFKWARARFGFTEGLVQVLEDEATRSGQANSSTFPPCRAELEASITHARHRLETQVEKYFVSRTDRIRWLAEFAKNPVVAFVILAIGFIARPAVEEVVGWSVQQLVGTPEKPAQRTWTTEIKEVDFAGYLQPGQTFVLNVDGSKRPPVPVEPRRNHYQGPEIATRTEEGVAIRIELRSIEDAVILSGNASLSRTDLIQPGDLETLVPNGSEWRKNPNGFWRLLRSGGRCRDSRRGGGSHAGVSSVRGSG